MSADGDLAAEASELVYKTQIVGNSFQLLPGFAVERVFDDFWQTTGFYAVGFVSPDHTIITIRGSEDRLDVISDADLGIPQYQRYRVPLIDFIGTQLIGGRVTLVGHSLGGGLAQYLAYDAAREFPALRDRLAIQTHNALGALAGIVRLAGHYDPSILEGVTVRNYRHPADVVSRIGGQVGGNVLNLVVDKKPVSPILAHSNDHFLPHKSPGALARALASADDAFALDQSLDRLTPGLAAAAEEILAGGAGAAGVKRIMRLVLRMPAKERRALGDAVTEFFPLKPLWRRMFGRRLVPPTERRPS